MPNYAHMHAESQKRSEKGSNFKEVDNAFALYYFYSMVRPLLESIVKSKDGEQKIGKRDRYGKIKVKRKTHGKEAIVVCRWKGFKGRLCGRRK